LDYAVQLRPLIRPSATFSLREKGLAEDQNESGYKIQNTKKPLSRKWKGLEIVGVLGALRFRPLVPRRFQNSSGMAGFLARGSALLRAFPGIPSGMLRSRYSLTVAGQRGSCTLFPFNRTLLWVRHQTGW